MGGATFNEVKRILSARVPLVFDAPLLIRASVLLLLYSKAGDYHILFTKRTSRVEHHKGEISFPGGGMDLGDSDLWETALRETQEEIGVDPHHTEYLGTLDQGFTTSGFLITPFVGTIPYPYPFRPSNVEVAEILEVPVSHLLDPTYAEPQEEWLGDKLVASWDYHYSEHIIWGATARILTQFLGLVSDALVRPKRGTS